MNKKTFAILLSLVLGMTCFSALAVDAVSSATVNVTTLPEIQEHENANTLVIWFSTNDTVKAVALTAADALGADNFEIVPEQPYTEADLAYYTDGRCDREQADDSARPGIVNWPENMDQYDVVFIGYPIWHARPRRSCIRCWRASTCPARRSCRSAPPCPAARAPARPIWPS